MTKVDADIPVKTLHLFQIINKVEFIGDKKLGEVALHMLSVMT